MRKRRKKTFCWKEPEIRVVINVVFPVPSIVNKMELVRCPTTTIEISRRFIVLEFKPKSAKKYFKLNINLKGTKRFRFSYVLISNTIHKGSYDPTCCRRKRSLSELC